MSFAEGEEVSRWPAGRGVPEEEVRETTASRFWGVRRRGVVIKMRVLKGVDGDTEEGGAVVMVRVYGEAEDCWREWVDVSVRAELRRCLEKGVSWKVEMDSGFAVLDVEVGKWMK